MLSIGPLANYIPCTVSYETSSPICICGIWCLIWISENAVDVEIIWCCTQTARGEKKLMRSFDTQSLVSVNPPHDTYSKNTLPVPCFVVFVLFCFFLFRLPCLGVICQSILHSLKSINLLFSPVPQSLPFLLNCVMSFCKPLCQILTLAFCQRWT